MGAGSTTLSQAANSGALAFGAATPGATGTTGRDSARRASRSGVAGARFTGAARRGAAESAEFGPRPKSGFGPRPTMGAEPPLDELGAARGTAGVPGSARGGAGYGQPLPAGTGNRAEQDREHRSKYLVHDDSNAIVGDLPPTAPPVIGADY
ncbi:MAG: hypothetical protein ACRDSH_05150 [Pseudonocardiaceae bacterium]